MSTINVTLKQGIVKNEIGESISPITSTDTVYMGNQKLTDILSSSGSIDFSEVTEMLDNISSNIGTTSDIGGTSTSGSMNAKLNASLKNEQNISSIISQITLTLQTLSETINSNSNTLNDINTVVNEIKQDYINNINMLDGINGEVI